MPIEPLVLYKQLDGDRVICTYFPPHVSFEAQLMQKAPWASYATLVDSLIPEGQAVGELGISGGKAYEVKADNGGAYYVCGELVDGTREGRLWKLLPGLEAVNG